MASRTLQSPSARFAGRRPRGLDTRNRPRSAVIPDRFVAVSGPRVTSVKDARSGPRRRLALRAPALRSSTDLFMTGPYASPVPTITRRTDAPTVHVERRRRAIHVVVISHDHYDHLDQPPR